MALQFHYCLTAARRLKNAAKVLIGSSIAYDKGATKHHLLMFSQEGEDGILRRLFEKQDSGFYIDVGAHHPQRFSNTYFFYLRGWRGINIEPNPDSLKKFNHLRPRDINLEIGVASKKGALKYHRFEESALNTFDETAAISTNSIQIGDPISIPVEPLHAILDRYLPSNQTIDFMSIDAEGMDEDVAQSNDWERFRPRFLLIERRRTATVEQALNTSLHRIISAHSYSLIAKCMNTLIYQDSTVTTKG